MSIAGWLILLIAIFGTAAVARISWKHVTGQERCQSIGPVPLCYLVPARLVWGEADEFQKVEYGRKFARDLDAPLRLFPGGKHFTPEDHPDIIAEEIMKLVKTVHG